MTNEGKRRMLGQINLGKSMNSPTNPGDYELAVMNALNICIRRYGLKKTRMDDIARHADVTRISLYRRFGNRNALINTFLRYRSEQFHSRVKEAVYSSKTLEIAIETYLLNAIFLAVRDSGVRELVEVHHVLQNALEEDSSDVKNDIYEFWAPCLEKFNNKNELIALNDKQEFVDWLILVESSLILVVRGADWDKQRVTSIVKKYVLPAFSNKNE